jgi:hypothetical protein
MKRAAAAPRLFFVLHSRAEALSRRFALLYHRLPPKMRERADMTARLIVTAALATMLSSGAASAWIIGAKGNDTGGIIPWSPEAERTALATADQMCKWSSGWAQKSARIVNVRRVPGDYIVYACVFDGPLRRNGPG